MCCPEETANLPPKVPKCLYQSGSEAEDIVQRIESLTQTCARVLREELGGNVASKSIASSRPDRQVVPSQSEKRDDGHSTRSRVKERECDGPLAQVGETCCEVAELESRWVTRPCLDRTGEKGEDVVGATAGVEFFQPLRRPAKDDQCALGYRRTYRGVDGRKRRDACHKNPHPGRGARWPSLSGGFTASNDEVSKEV